MRVYVASAGILAPGLSGWADSRAVLAGERAYAGGELAAFDVAILPATERRRAGRSVKLAVDLAGQAMAGQTLDPAVVFASTTGDTEVLTAICESLATAERMISPMRFHNSVHNAASGYWTIARASRQPANAIALHQLTAAAGLLEAATQCLVDRTPVLLVVYDIPFPPPLDAVEPVSAVFGSSLLLLPEPTPGSMAALDIDLVEAGSAADAMRDPGLEALRQGVVAARMLPLLGLLAAGRAGRVHLDYLDGSQLRVSASPPMGGAA